MAKIHFDFLVLETFDRLFGVTALLDVLDQGIPDMEWREQEALRQMAEAESWDYNDYDVDRQVLDEKFRRWIPRFAAYSIITLFQSIVESQLLACAERVGKMRNASFRVKDIKGKGVEQATVYLQRLISLDVREDPAWSHLRNLQDLRNAIVHRGGKRGTSADQQKVMERLLTAYPGLLAFPDSPRESPYGEVWISMNLCRQFAREVEEFFKRVFKAVGLPEKGMQFVS